LPRGVLEQRERLEQLRALEAGMRISVSLIDPARLGVQVDTPADLERARALMRVWAQ
jgi:3-deoxy-manno-octulosonate cytidylyltransferase (CMP-KDO synthetase)